jgi:VanZ family protein
MASSSMVYEVYAPPVTVPARWREQLRIWLPVLAFSLVFAVESTSYLGAEHTSGPLRRVTEAIFGYDACVHWNAIHILIRKTGHFVGYGLFSLVCFRGFWIALRSMASRMQRLLRANGLALASTFLVASADETSSELCAQPHRAASAMCCWTPAAAWRSAFCSFWRCRQSSGSSRRARIRWWLTGELVIRVK